MRCANAAVTYSALTFARSAGTLVLRIVLVIGLRLGITGIYLADLVVTLDPVPLLWRWFRPLVCRDVLERRPARRRCASACRGCRTAWRSRRSTRQQAAARPVRAARARSASTRTASTLGTGVRFFTSAFETAWAPFYYATSRKPDAQQTCSRKMTTYGVAVLVLLVAGTTAVARDVDPRRCSSPSTWRPLPVVPIIAVGIALPGRVSADVDRPEPDEPDGVLPGLDARGGRRRIRGRARADAPLRRRRRRGDGARVLR